LSPFWLESILTRHTRPSWFKHKTIESSRRP
jgi:hypothetical protein